MKKFVYIFAILGSIVLSSNAFAQLPANPWVAKPPVPNDGDFGPNIPDKSPNKVPDAPIYGNGLTNGEMLPVDPWAASRDRTNTSTWRRSGRHGALNYVGEATTFGSDVGGERVAPEVNRHNMSVAMQHLRNMGYSIPTSYDNNIKNAPQEYKRMLRENYDALPNANDPLGKTFYQMMKGAESYSGLDFENLLFNSVDLISTD